MTYERCELYKYKMMDKVAIFVGFASAFLIGLNICIMIHKLKNK